MCAVAVRFEVTDTVLSRVELASGALARTRIRSLLIRSHLTALTENLVVDRGEPLVAFHRYRLSGASFRSKETGHDEADRPRSPRPGPWNRAGVLQNRPGLPSSQAHLGSALCRRARHESSRETRESDRSPRRAGSLPM